jgi:hypothetical protein
LAKSDPENKPIAVIRADLETKLGAASGENDELMKMSPKSDEEIKQLADVKETDTSKLMPEIFLRLSHCSKEVKEFHGGSLKYVFRRIEVLFMS